MAEDPLAEAVGRLMSEEQNTLDPRLEKLALGTITDVERADLEAAAKSDPELARALSLHAPLSPQFKSRLIETTRPRARVIVLRRAAAIGAIAAAAGIALFALNAGDPIPEYALLARAGDAELRGHEEDRNREVRADSTIELVMRPNVPAEGELDAMLFVLAGDTVQRSPIAGEISKDGAVRWIGRADAIAPGRTGRVTLIAMVGRRGELPESGVDSRARSNAWQSEAVEVLIRPAGEAP